MTFRYIRKKAKAVVTKTEPLESAWRPRLLFTPVTGYIYRFWRLSPWLRVLFRKGITNSRYCISPPISGSKISVNRRTTKLDTQGVWVESKDRLSHPCTCKLSHQCTCKLSHQCTCKLSHQCTCKLTCMLALCCWTTFRENHYDLLVYRYTTFHENK